MRKFPEEEILTDATRVLQVTVKPDGSCPETPEEAITDLLADIRHYCAAYELDFDRLSTTSFNHFIEEARPVQWEDDPTLTLSEQMGELSK